jgi:hypothetical protein
VKQDFFWFESLSKFPFAKAPANPLIFLQVFRSQRSLYLGFMSCFRWRQENGVFLVLVDLAVQLASNWARRICGAWNKPV